MTRERFIKLVMEAGAEEDGIGELWDSRPPEVDTMSDEDVIRALRLALLIFSLQKAEKARMN